VRPHDAPHLGQRTCRCVDVRDREAAHRSVEPAVEERERAHVADHRRRCRVADEAQHVARHVHGDGSCANRPEHAAQRSGSGADIDHSRARNVSATPAIAIDASPSYSTAGPRAHATAVPW